MPGCPDLAEIERLAGSSAADGPWVEHLSHCTSCHAALRRVRENNALLNALRREGGRADPVPEVYSVPGYEILREIGHGGQGRVYLALQRATRREVALKFLLDFAKHSERRRARFEREIELAARLSHPNIVAVFEGGLTAGGDLYCAMQHIPGRPLSEGWSAPAAVPKSLRGNLAAALSLFLEICDAVHYAHQRGVIHRDLKPGNILIDAAGRPHILDFGLARALDQGSAEQAARFTQTGDFLGTLAYAAPEQVRGEPDALDVRTDVYALGLILYELLRGRLPYAVDVPLAQVIQNITTSAPAPLRTSTEPPRGPIDDELETITLKAIAKEPERRYQSAGELAADLRRYLADEPVEAKRDSRGYVLGKLIHRHRVAVGIFAAFLLVLAGATVVSTWLWYSATHAQARADTAEKAADRRGGYVKMEAARVEAVSRFLAGLLETPDPGGRTHDLSPRELLDRAAANVERELGGQPDLAAGLKDVIGATYHALGDYERAERLLREALAHHRTTAADRPDSLGISLVNLAAILEDRGQHREAEALCREGLALLGTALGRSDENYVNSLNILAYTLESQQRLDEAEAVMREALALVRSIHGQRAAPVASRLNGIALLADRRGEKKVAEELFREALDISRTMNGERHPITATILNNLAGTLSDQGEWAEAEGFFKTALDLQESLTGRNDPEYATCQHNLATCLSRQDRNAESEPLAREALAVRERALGPQHEDVGRTLLCLAVIRAAQDDFEESAGLAKRALDLFANLDPPDPAAVARARELLDRVAAQSASRPAD